MIANHFDIIFNQNDTILKGANDGGGDGSISEVRFVEGLTDEQVISLFQNARKSDCEKIIQDANQLLAEWSSRNRNPRDPKVGEFP